MNLKMAAYTTLVMTLASTSRAFSPRVLNRGNIGFSSTPTLSLSKLLSTTTETSADTEQSVSETSTSIYDVQAEALSKVQSPFIKTLRDRGFLHQCTNLEALDEAMMEAQKDGGALPAYLGFDATADSLHVESLLRIMILRHLQKSDVCLGKTSIRLYCP